MGHNKMMADFPCIHHIEVGVLDGPAAVTQLQTQFSFRVKAVRTTDVADQWLLVNNDTRFLITSMKTTDTTQIQKDDFVLNWMSKEHLGVYMSEKPTKSTVFNVAFQVKDIDVSLQRLQEQSVYFPKQLRTARDADGSVRTCAVKSCVGDIYHTLVDKASYSGHFLPGFTTVSDHNDHYNKDVRDSMETCLSFFDHAAFSVPMNTSTAVISWYERCFGMKRFMINSEEDEDRGLLLSSFGVGLRLRAMEYWKCAEVGLTMQNRETGKNKLSFVIAEGLPPVPGDTEENQIESWMRQHGGPGIQHIAITSTDIKSTVQNLKRRGLQFAKPPPPTYYTEDGRLHDIIAAKEDVESLQQNGILIDTEADRDVNSASSQQRTGKESYLLQIFTAPVFPKDPFFMEIIQRQGATGFGSGNVKALYRSVQAYIVQEDVS